MSPQPPPPEPPATSLSSSSQADSGENEFTDEAPTAAPWLDIIDIRSLSVPNSIVDVKTRFNINITRFQINYLNVVISIFYLFLGFFISAMPFDFTFFYVTSMACFVFYVSVPPSTPLELRVLGFIFIVHRNFFLGLLLVIVVLPFALQQAWVHLLSFFLISAAIVGLHSILIRAPTCECDGLLLVEPRDIV